MSDLISRQDCPMRHDNGNCLPIGGFCTANKNICEGLRNAYIMGLRYSVNQQVTGKLKNGEDSSVRNDTTESKEHKSKLDLISRQAAIRWVKTECNPYGKPTLDFESGKKVIEHLKQMPSLDESADRPRIGRWKHVQNGGVTPGGTPLYACENCGGSMHLHGAEYPERKVFCDECGCVNLYPWEKCKEEEE